MKRLITLLLTFTAIMIMTSCKDDSIGKLYKTVCPADEALALAKSSSAVVIEFQGCTSGKEVWDEFYRNVSEGKEASVLCAHYYTLDSGNISEDLYEQEKDQYPQLYWYLIRYDGTSFSINTRLSSSETEEDQETYSCLCHYTGDAPTSDALYDSYDYYVLTDDPDVTWDEIVASMLDSSDPSMIRHCMVYDDYSGWSGN